MSWRRVCFSCGILVHVGLVAAQDDAGVQSDEPSGAAPAQAEEVAADPAPKGILPIPDSSGDIWTRPVLTGDWNGSREDIAEKGIQFQLSWNQYLQDMVAGGRNNALRYGGNGDYLINFDLDRMGVLRGGIVTFRAESRYGDSVNAESGLLLPVNTDALFPLAGSTDQSIPLTITNLYYTQYFSETFAVFGGKFDTLNGDANEFASGRGTRQFMNSNFVFNPALALRFPYSTLGAGALWAPEEWVTLSATAFQTADSSTTSGFENFGDGISVTVEADFQYRLGKMPGGMNVGGLYSFDQDFNKIGGRFVFEPGEGLVTPTEDDTWALYWSGWQYLWVQEPTDAKINTGDGRPDHVGVGLFARLGVADEETNPIEWSGSIGVGGRGLLPGREEDTYGVGYFYNGLQTTQFSGLVGISDQVQGLEVFYDIAITPAAHLTLDFQAVEPAVPNVDTAFILGARLGLSF